MKKRSRFFSAIDRYIIGYVLFLLICFVVSAHKYQSDSDPAEYAKKILLIDSEHIQKSFFVPKDDVEQIIIGLIKLEQKCIYIAQYRITNKKIAQALKEAKDRGIRIYIITDFSCFADRYQKITD